MPALRRHCRRLRTALLVLLVLGMVISPTLAAVGELHAMEHAAAANDHAHGHAHSADNDHHRQDHDGDRPNPEHAAGGHGLMHQSASPSVTIPDEPVTVSRVALCEPLLPELRRRHLPGDPPDLPFRPPIA